MLPASGEASRPDIRMRPGARIRGRVLLPDGRPDGKATVNVGHVGAAKSLCCRFAKTDVDGRFEVTGLAAGEYHVVVAWRDGKSVLHPEAWPEAGSVKALELREGEVKELDL